MQPDKKIMKACQKMKIIISGGGTGGHIYPAIAIADEIKRRNENADILFVGAKGRMEMQRVPKAGYPIKGLWISGIQRKWSLKNLVVPIKLISSLIKAGRILRTFRPDVVVGVGGYASGPMLRVSSLFGAPTLIQEQNSYAGITNRLLSAHVDRICVAYENMERFFPAGKLLLTGNPVRADLQNLETKLNEAKSFFEWGHKKTIFMFGGSLGAKSFNDAVVNAHDRIRSNKDVLFIWQTGSRYYDELKNHSVARLENVRVMPFVERMDLAYSLADIVIARAGALTISELQIVGKPVVLIPSPNVAEDHQSKNAEALESQKAAIKVDECEMKEKLFDLAYNLLYDENRKLQLGQNIKRMARPEATRLIVDEIMNIVD